MSCKRAQEFLGRYNSIQIGERIDARKSPRGRNEALRLAKSAKKVLTGRGSTLNEWDMVNDPPDDDTLSLAILGPTGNLKAPTFKMGDTLVVGYDEAAYRRLFG